MKRIFLLFLVFIVAITFSSCQSSTYRAVLVAGNDTVEINSEWVDAGAKLVNNTTKEYIMTTMDEVDTSQIGVQIVTYNYALNEVHYTLKRYVNIVDQTPPVLELKPGVDTLKVNETWQDAGVYVSDNSGEDATVLKTGTVNNQNAGTYEIIYTATDSSGNSSSIVRYVNFIE